MKKQNFYSTQEWLPFESILDNGIIKLKDFTYVKIIKVEPINLSLKSELEKSAILFSYQNFLKTYEGSLQIIIQSKKEDLSKHVAVVEGNISKETEEICKLSYKYLNFIQELNFEKKSSSKNFYIIIKELNQENFHEKYLKIKDLLSRSRK